MNVEFKIQILFRIMESSSRVNVGKGKSAFDKKGMGEIFGSKDVIISLYNSFKNRQSTKKLRLILNILK